MLSFFSSIVAISWWTFTFCLLNSFMMYETDVFIGMIEYFFSCFILSSQKLFFIHMLHWLNNYRLIYWKIGFLLCWYNEQIESLIDFFFFSSVISIESLLSPFFFFFWKKSVECMITIFDLWQPHFCFLLIKIRKKNLRKIAK